MQEVEQRRRPAGMLEVTTPGKGGGRVAPGAATENNAGAVVGAVAELE